MIDHYVDVLYSPAELEEVRPFTLFDLLTESVDEFGERAVIEELLGG